MHSTSYLPELLTQIFFRSFPFSIQVFDFNYQLINICNMIEILRKHYKDISKEF